MGWDEDLKVFFNCFHERLKYEGWSNITFTCTTSYTQSRFISSEQCNEKQMAFAIRQIWIWILDLLLISSMTLDILFILVKFNFPQVEKEGNYNTHLQCYCDVSKEIIQ